MTLIHYFADVHLPSVHTANSSKRHQVLLRERVNTLACMGDFVAQAVKEKPDFVVGGGDHILSTPDRRVDMELQDDIWQLLSPVSSIAKLLPGNQDVRNLKPFELHRRFNYLASSEIIAMPDATFLFWVANVMPRFFELQDHPHITKKYYEATQADVAELKQMLMTAPFGKPVLMFLHVPIDIDARNNPVDFLEQHNADRACYRNGKAIVKLLESSGHRVFVFSGHRHFNTTRQVAKNIHVMQIDRMVRHSDKEKRMAGRNWASIQVNQGVLTYKRHGAQPMEMALNI